MRGKKAKILRKEFRSTQFAELPTFSETNVHKKEFVVGQQFNEKGELEDRKIVMRLSTIGNPRSRAFRLMKKRCK